MPPGRRPKPIEEKRRLGNPGKRPLPNPVTAIKPVEVEVVTGGAPQSGKELVDALMAAGAAAWVSETDALATLRLLQDGWDERARLREHIAEHGYSYSVNGRIYARPEAGAIRELEKQITVWLSQLGLNPSDRGRLGLAEVKAKATGLAALREERAAKAGRRAG